MFRADVVGVSSALAMHLVLIPTYGLIGAALGKLCGDVVTAVGALVVLRRQFTPAILNSVLVAVAAGIGLFGALSIADHNGLPWPVAIAICLPVIGAGLCMVPHVRQELRCLAA
jgi:O-antigen/teichoic acid export membrane protein